MRQRSRCLREIPLNIKGSRKTSRPRSHGNTQGTQCSLSNSESTSQTMSVKGLQNVFLEIKVTITYGSDWTMSTATPYVNQRRALMPSLTHSRSNQMIVNHCVNLR